MKNLANCKLSEFLPAAYRVREAFHKYYHLIDVDGLRKRFIEKSQKEGINTEILSTEFIGEIVKAMMLTYPKETVKIISLIGFMEQDEAEELSPTDAIAMIIECICSSRVMDFFISLEGSAGGDTDGILLTLILLKQSFTATATSETESQTDTNETVENNSAGDMQAIV